METRESSLVVALQVLDLGIFDSGTVARQAGVGDDDVEGCDAVGCLEVFDRSCGVGI